MPDLLKIAAAYIRVSDERQDEYSPDSQLKKIREHASRKGYFIPDEYVFYDDGISGKSVRRRGDFNRMIALAKEKDHPFDIIFVWKFSRFARNQEESLVYKNLLRKKNVTVESVSETIPEGPYGTLIERIIEWMDEFYLINLGAEVVRGMTEKASRGEPTCAPPIGYYMKDKKYYPDEKYAPVVQEIFERYAAGEGVRNIVTNLRDRGIKSPQGALIDQRRIDYILHNACYVGKIRWSPDGSKAVSKRHYDNENIMVVDGHHEPLISMEIWEKVQTRLAKVKQQYGKYQRPEQPTSHMLHGLVKCSSCGGTLAIGGRSGKNNTPCLQCCNYSRGSCKTSHSVTLPKIETAVIEGLKTAIGEKTFTLSPTLPKNRTVTHETADYDKLIAAEERKLIRAKEAYLAEIDSIEQYAKNKADITARIKDLIAKRNAAGIADSTATGTDIDALAAKVSDILAFITTDNPTVTPDAKNAALRTIIHHIIYDKANSNLAIFFHP